MIKIAKIICPEHDQTEFIEVTEGGRISWCSRVGGTPVCCETCLSQLRRSEAAERLQPTKLVEPE